MISLLKKAHVAWYYFVVLFYFILAYPILFFLVREPKRHYTQIVFFRKWISVLACRSVGIRFAVKYEQAIDWTKPYIICPNHTSVLDITIVNDIIPQSFSFMGKIELLQNPVTKIFFNSVDITVDRNSKMSAFRAFKRADQLIKEGKSVVIFPEGKIDDEYPPELHEFKSGPFRIALENQTPIIPVVIQDAWTILWDSGWKFGSRPGLIHISVLKPIDTDLLTAADLPHLQATVYDRMKKHWTEYNTEKINKNKKLFS